MLEHHAPPAALALDEADVIALVAQHAGLRALCNELEACADLLPGRAGLHHATLLTAQLAIDLKRHQGFDAALLGSRGGPGAATSAGVVLARARACHASDQLHAEDLHEALHAAAISPARLPAEMLGYMMRSMFEGCRRSIDFQEATILWLAGDHFDAAARDRLCDSLARR